MADSEDAVAAYSCKLIWKGAVEFLITMLNKVCQSHLRGRPGDINVNRAALADADLQCETCFSVILYITLT